jgi:ABC-type glycerol-3-phosphate transport system permease component
MEWLLGLEVVVIMTVLRLVVPVFIMFLLAYALHRLEARWQVTPSPLGPVAGD